MVGKVRSQRVAAAREDEVGADAGGKILDLVSARMTTPQSTAFASVTALASTASMYGQIALARRFSRPKL